jgi:hypothetical protein
MKEKTAFILLYSLYVLTVLINQAWKLGEGDVTLWATGKTYPADWYIYFIAKSFNISIWIFGVYLATFIKKNKKGVRFIALYFVGFTLLGMILFSGFQFKKPVELEIIYLALFLIIPTIKFFNFLRHQS